MYVPPIKGRKSLKNPQVPQARDLIDGVGGVIEVANRLNNLEKTVQNAVSVLDEKKKEVDDAVSTFEDTTIEILKVVKEIKKGDPGNSPDEDIIVNRVLERVPKLDENRLRISILSYVPTIDYAKITKEVLKKIPENKASLQIIKENVEVDPLAIIDKIMSLPDEARSKLQLGTSNISGLDQTINAFRGQLGRGYLHGGGLSTVSHDATLTGTGTPTDPLKVVGGGGSGVSSFNTRTGDVTLTSLDVTTALGYTPEGSLWQRNSTTLSPFTPGDNINTSGSISLGTAVLGQNGITTNHVYTNPSASPTEGNFVAQIAQTSASTAFQANALNASINVIAANTQNWTNSIGLGAGQYAITVAAAATGTITSIGSIKVAMAQNSTGLTITNAFGIKLQPPGGAGAISNITNFSYLTAGTNGQSAGNYFIDASNVTYQSVFGGNVGIGLAAGVATQNRLDVLRGTAGTMGKGTYETASFEFNGDNKVGIYTSSASSSDGASFLFGQTNLLAGSSYPGFEVQYIYNSTYANNMMRFNAVQRNSSGTVIGSTANIFNVFASGNVAIGGSGTQPAARLSITSTTEQLRTSYDAADFTSFTNASNGTLTMSGNGTNAGFVFTPSGTGTNTFNSNVSGSAPGNIFNNNNASATPSNASFLAPNATAGSTSQGPFMNVGVASSNQNSGVIQLNYLAAGGANNSLSFGLYGTANPFYVFKDRASIGTATQGGILNIGAGTTSIAPVTLTSGTNTTSIVNGAFEYNGTHLTFAIGGVRYQLDQQSGTSYTAGSGLTLTGTVFSLDLTHANTWIGQQTFQQTSSADVVAIQNNSVSGYSSIKFNDNTGTEATAFGYANGSAAAPLTGSFFLATISKPIIFNVNSGGSTNAIKIDTSSNVGLPATLSAGGLVKAATTTGNLSIATAGTDYQAPITLTTTGTGAATFVSNVLNIPTPSAGGTPGGLNTQLQYNNAGAFAGITGATTNGTIVSLTNPLLGGATLTTSSVNGVTLTTGGSATTYLNGSGAYTTPVGTTYSAGTGLTLTTTTFSVNASQNITTLSNLTTNGVVTTTGGTGTLAVVASTTLTSGSTNALQSATTTVNVSSATAPTSGQVLTATSGTAATWQTPVPVALPPQTLIATVYETAGRFSVTSSNGGAVTFSSSGCELAIAGTASSSARTSYVSTFNASTNFNIFNGSPTYTHSVNLQKNGGAAPNNSVYWSIIGLAPINASTSTAKHVGFKVIFTGSTGSLFATQADGTTENVSSALITGIVDDTILDLAVVMNGSTSATYYYRQNGGSQSSVTLTTNIPTGDLGSATYFSSSLSGYTGTPITYAAFLNSSSYSR